MTSPWLLIPAFIIFLLFLPVILELKLSYNVLTNTGVISLYVYKWNVIYYIFEIKENAINLKNQNETMQKELDLNSTEVIFSKEFVKEVVDKLRLRYLGVFYNIGVEDAFQSSLLCGYINTFFLMLFSYIKNKKPTATLGLHDTVSYNEREAMIVTNVNLSISLFDLVYSLLLSVILTMKIKNNSLKN